MEKEKVEKEIEKALYEIFEFFFPNSVRDPSKVIIINPHLIIEQARALLKVEVPYSEVKKVFVKFCKEKGIYAD